MAEAGLRIRAQMIFAELENTGNLDLPAAKRARDESGYQGKRQTSQGAVLLEVVS